MPARPPTTFSASDQRTRMVLDQVEKERAATDAKTARLKALRLAKEAEDKTKTVQAPSPAKPRRKRNT
jgi:hypothetical protein